MRPKLRQPGGSRPVRENRKDGAGAVSRTDRELARGRDPQVRRLLAQGWEGGCWVPPTWEASPLPPDTGWH